MTPKAVTEFWKAMGMPITSIFRIMEKSSLKSVLDRRRISSRRITTRL